MQVANSDKRLIDWLKENFGGSIHITREGHGRKFYQWTLGSKDTYRLLKEIKDLHLPMGKGLVQKREKERTEE